MAESTVVQSRVKETVQSVEADFRISADFLDALDGHVRAILKEAVVRARANGRKTLQSQDL